MYVILNYFNTFVSKLVITVRCNEISDYILDTDEESEINPQLKHKKHIYNNVRDTAFNMNIKNYNYTSHQKNLEDNYLVRKSNNILEPEIPSFDPTNRYNALRINSVEEHEECMLN